MNWQQYYEKNKDLGLDEARTRFRRLEQQEFESEAAMYEASRGGSNAANIAGAAGGGQLRRPNLSAAINSSPNTIVLSWTFVAGANNYVLERATNQAFTANHSTVYTGNLLTFTNSNLATNTTYFYRVKSQKTTNSNTPDSVYSNIEEIATAVSYGGALGITNL